MKRTALILLVMMVLLSACSSPPDPSEPTATPKPTETLLPPTRTPKPTNTSLPCLPSGTQEDINARLVRPGSVAVLCQDAVFELSAPVVFSADAQKVYTEGHPTDEHRAVLRIVSSGVTTAVLMRDRSNAVLSNLIIDGNRPELDYMRGEALVYAGGYSSGQIIRDNLIMEPRSWSALQLIEYCVDALVENNQIGPAGQPDGTWADGISLACTNTVVRNNLIVDATDGAIVIFAATGSIIEDNIIRAETRTLLGGIHLVADVINDSDYTGVIVRNNLIESAGAVIRIAVPMGPRTWICVDQDQQVETIFGATVIDNTLRGDQVQYGFIADGVSDWTVTGNIDESTHIGVPTIDCRGVVASPPAGFQFNPERAEGVFQPEFEPANLELALWAIVAPAP